jgi:hypothetical protein
VATGAESRVAVQLVRKGLPGRNVDEVGSDAIRVGNKTATAIRTSLAKGSCETNSSFPLVLVLVLVLEIPSVKTARTNSIAFCDSFSHGDIQARRMQALSDLEQEHEHEHERRAQFATASS